MDLAAGPLRLIWDAGAQLGEGANWDDAEGCLWWVDIRGRRLHRCDAEGAGRRSWDLPEEVGHIALRRNPGGLLLGLRRGVAAFDPQSGSIERLAEPEGHPAEHRLNDGKLDPAGRLWFGTMHDDEHEGSGALHLMPEPGRTVQVAGPLTVPNGPAFSPDGQTLYLADSPQRVVYAFEVAGESLGPRRDVIRFAEADGYPDGMTVDAEGCLWVAHWDGGCVSRHAPDGRELGRIALPTPKVTSCAFGGPDLRLLFLTTAGGNGEAGQGAAGALFAVPTTVTGVTPPRAA